MLLLAADDNHDLGKVFTDVSAELLGLHVRSLGALPVLELRAREAEPRVGLGKRRFEAGGLQGVEFSPLVVFQVL